MVSDLEHENSRTFIARSREANGVVQEMASIFQQLVDMGNRQMEADGVPLDKTRIRKSADMRYIGQSHEIEVTIANEISQEILNKAVDDFHIQHELAYGYNKIGITVEFVNLRTVHYYSSPPKLPNLEYAGSLEAAQKGTRQAYFGEFVEVPVYEREKLPPQQIVKGPTIIEQPDCTTLVYPGQLCIVGSSGNLLLREKVSKGDK
ncbi:hypothetical protein ACFL0M_15065 [Thermodesulfobacteriota bacterium]